MTEERQRKISTGKLAFDIAVSWAFVFGCASLFYAGINYGLDQAGLQDLPVKTNQLLGVGAAVVTAIYGGFYTWYGQNRIHKDQEIRQYQVAEEILMDPDNQGVIEKELTQESMRAYHATYGWSGYAALSFSAVFVIIVLIFTAGPNLFKDNPIQEVSAYVAVGLLAVSAVVLTLIDALHTNSLSPLVPTDSRFRLIKVIIGFGFLAILLQVLALGVFLSLLHWAVSWVTCAVALAIMVLASQIRVISKQSVIKERGISGELAEQFKSQDM